MDSRVACHAIVFTHICQCRMYWGCTKVIANDPNQYVGFPLKQERQSQVPMTVLPEKTGGETDVEGSSSLPQAPARVATFLRSMSQIRTQLQSAMYTKLPVKLNGSPAQQFVGCNFNDIGIYSSHIMGLSRLVSFRAKENK